MNDPAAATVETTAEIPTNQVKIADLENAVNEGNKVDIAPDGKVTISELDPTGGQPSEFSDIADLAEETQGHPTGGEKAFATDSVEAGETGPAQTTIRVPLEEVVAALSAHFVTRAEFDALNQKLQKWGAEYDAMTDKLGTHGIRLDPEPEPEPTA